MKKIVLVLIAVVAVGSLCFAQQPSTTATKQVSAPAKPGNFSGKIDSIVVVDATKGTHSEITVVDATGQEMAFLVRVNTIIAAQDGRQLTLTDLKQGNKVEVTYIVTKLGNNAALSIKLVE
ncbi:MAG TPA: hypothetical protein VMD52_01280 [Patescibacteria group bacterium]|nr:hypothetical protein [Patescibacteria group bacterium]